MKPKPLTVFWGNERVTHQAILAIQREETMARLQGEERVLLVQDTTSFNFSHHPETVGLGPLENKGCEGFLAHNTLAVSTAGVALGLVEQVVWARPPVVEGEKSTRSKRHQRAFAEKESYKWVNGLPKQTWAKALPSAVIVCDAEAHIYEFLDEVLTQELDFIVRASDYRSFTPEGQSLFHAVSEQPVQDHYTIELQRRPDRDARTAELELRFAQVTLRRPKRAICERETLTVYVVDVQEVNTPTGETGIHWLLLTSLPVESISQAHEVLRFYTYRWLIERFHYVLKSGCKFEERQLRAEERLERLLAVYNQVAWQLLWLTYQARQTPDAPCTVALRTSEWQALYAFIHRNQKLPQKPPSLRQSVRWIGQLGGFLGRKGDGDPGVKVLWQGWQRLQDITSTWLIFHPSKDVGNV